MKKLYKLVLVVMVLLIATTVNGASEVTDDSLWLKEGDLLIEELKFKDKDIEIKQAILETIRNIKDKETRQVQLDKLNKAIEEKNNRQETHKQGVIKLVVSYIVIIVIMVLVVIFYKKYQHDKNLKVV